MAPTQNLLLGVQLMAKFMKHIDTAAVHIMGKVDSIQALLMASLRWQLFPLKVKKKWNTNTDLRVLSFILNGFPDVY